MFRAYDAQRERLVAVKLFRLDLPPERVHRLVDDFETLIAAELSHPALAAPLATGIVGASAYLAQDYVAAEALDLAVREYGPAPPADALRVAAQLAGALDFAAVVDINHGMMHPRDVLLSSDETRLTGIGVGRALEKAGVTVPVRRPYTAPERLAGGSWTRRADTFGLAALIFELMFGHRISGPGARAVDGVTEVAGARLAALQSAFARALAEDPADRFESALEFVDALKEGLPGVTLGDASASKARTAATAPAKKEEEEPRLPLDEPIVAAPVPLPPVVAPVPTAAPVDVDLRASTHERFRDLETPVDLTNVRPSTDSEGIDLVTEPAAPSSAVWPLMAALVIGLAVGFAGGYGVGSRERAAPGDGRESTDVAVTEPVKPAPPAEPAAARPGVPAPPDVRRTRPAPDQNARPPQPAPVLSATKAPSQSAPVEGPGRLLVRTTPAGALVAVDGRDAGTTPLAVRNLTEGVHRVHIQRDGYLAEDRRVTISRARPAQSMIVALERPRTPPVSDAANLAGVASTGRFAGSLAVESRPAGAKVYLDGRLMGVTPLALATTPAGEHAIRLERDGYQRWSSSIRIVAAEQNRVTASLEK